MIKIQIDKIEMVPVEKLKPHPKNPNQHDQSQIEMLAKQYEHQGMRTAIIVEPTTFQIVSGHARHLAALRAGLKEVPVSFQAFDSEEQLYAFMVADNSSSKWSDLDLSQIHLDLAELEPFDIDLLAIQNFEFEPEPQKDKKPGKTCPNCGESI